jgi:non-heme chloroperoxidase
MPDTPIRPRLNHLRLRNGLRLEYAEQGPRGSRPSLLFLHGITDSWRSFKSVLSALPREWHAIALTQRGHGGSDKPAAGYRASDYAADAATLIGMLALPQVIVVGHSMGAANALRLAAQHPALVCGVVAAGAFATFSDKPELAAFVREAIEPLTDPVPRTLAHQFQMDTLARPCAPGWVDTAVDESLRLPAAVWRAAFRDLLADDPIDAAPRIAVPVRLVAGECDAFAPLADAERLARAMPDAEVSVWASAGHAMHWEEPARFAREVAEFVRRRAGQAATDKGALARSPG